MDLSDIFKNVNTFIGDSSNDRVSAEDRFQAATEATAWLLEELGNEHMTDRATIEYLPTVTWYKMDNLTPYLLTAGQLRYKERDDHVDFTRVEPRELESMNENKHAYAIERYDGDAYLGIVIPDSEEYTYQELIALNMNDGYTYTGTNATNISGEKNAIRFDMQNTGQTSSGIKTTTSTIDISDYSENGVIVFEYEIPDITDVTSVSIKFGDDLTTDYYIGTVTQDVNGNALAEGVNSIKINVSDLTTVGSPSLSSIEEWEFLVNHDAAKAVATDFRVSDLRITTPIFLNFKYIFYRVGKDASGTDLIEFSATTDVPFFMDRYPQYRYAVAHKTAGILFRSMTDYDSAGSEDSQASAALRRFRKNFSTERDMSNSAFRPAGINFRSRRIIRRRN
tara:strand:- start:15039 stop:16220 length:1182 start_codon:yes stop_codon:yes gene_type:complete